MKLGTIWLLFVLLMFSCVHLVFTDKIGFPELLAFPAASLFLLLVGVVYKRAGSLKNLVALFPLKLYSFLHIPLRLLRRERYMTKPTSYVTDDSLVTKVSYLGLDVEFSSNLDSAIDEYLELVDEDGDVNIRRDTKLDVFSGAIESANCSTCVHSDNLNTSVDVQWSYDTRFSWTMTLCANCWKTVMKEQLRALSEESEFESKVVINQL